MTSDAEANALFWKAYSTAILEMLTSGGAGLGTNSRVYITSSNQRAIPGGSGVPEEITNWGVHNLANNLLDANGGVTFNPTASIGGYVEALALYLEAIKPVSNDVNKQMMARLHAAQANVDAADLRVTAILKATVPQYSYDPNGKGVTPWLSWCHRNAPQYVATLKNYNEAKDMLIYVTDAVYGPGVGQLTQDLKVPSNALNTTAPIENGVTMGASLDDITMDSALTLHFPSPLHVFTVPAYTITGYGEAIDGWMLTSTDGMEPAFTSTISSTVGRQYDAKSFGHDEASGSGGFDLGFISAGAGGGTSTDTSSFQFGQWVDEVTLTLTVNFVQTLTINPGQWDVDFMDLAAKMGVRPPSSVTPRVRPTQALFASGVGLKATFGAAAGSQFDTFYKKNQAASGGFSIFGFHVGGSESSSITKATNKCTWDVASCTLTIPPAPTAHNAQLLAVIGEVVFL
ncbi:hypothetical protein QBC39DRAFT_371933 [Podospora conica]|nr:hypothetical protein QBC39DRAFT_371933 [Schizothecium conicum]